MMGNTTGSDIEEISNQNDKNQNLKLKYQLDLPDDLTTILAQDFWVTENISPIMLQSLSDPVKFSASTWIYVEKGECRGDISLINYDMKAPTLVWVRSSEILNTNYISPDFRASVLVMSKRFAENLFVFLTNNSLHSIALRHPVVEIPEDCVPAFNRFFRDLIRITSEPQNPYSSQALLYTILSFIYTDGYKCYEPYRDEVMSSQHRLTSRFIQLVQQNFRKERFLDFYANALEISPKHLSRTIKRETGFTAVQWIEKFIILEASVLLKSSNLNIQQIADELNFPSQSFFGKYFKKVTGMSPKDFRNAQIK